MIITTSRLVARPLHGKDYKFLRHLHSNPLSMAELGGVRDERKTKENLDWNLEHWKQHQFGLWVFSLKENSLRENQLSMPIGLVGFRQIEFLGLREFDLAYVLLPQFWHLGLAFEASVQVLSTAFNDFQITHMMAKTRTTNFASQRVIQKLGFTFEREIIDFDHPHFQYRIDLSKASNLSKD